MIDTRLEIIRKAFSAQRELNHRLRPDWAEQGWKYYRAIWYEVTEVFDHLNWEWWKHGTYGMEPTPQQIRDVHMELCDVLHFGLSLDIVRHTQGGESTMDRAKSYADAFRVAETSDEPLDVALENLMIDALLIREFNVKKFAKACNAAGLSLTGLMAYYFGKGALNRFRWDNGYNLPKDDPARYIKLWQLPGSTWAAEDNQHLGVAMDVVTAHIESAGLNLETEIASGGYAIQVYTKLSEMYALRV